MSYFFIGREASEKINQINMHHGIDGSAGIAGSSTGNF